MASDGTLTGLSTAAGYTLASKKNKFIGLAPPPVTSLTNGQQYNLYTDNATNAVSAALAMGFTNVFAGIAPPGTVPAAAAVGTWGGATGAPPPPGIAVVAQA